MIRRIIFVDEDNTGLGPFAAALFMKKTAEGPGNLTADSRGTVVLFPEPVNSMIAKIAMKYGVDISDHQAEKLSEEDYEADVLMLALDSASQKRAFAAHSGFSSIFILKEYVGETGDVRTPLGGNEEKYEGVCETIDRLIMQLIQKLKDEEILS